MRYFILLLLPLFAHATPVKPGIDQLFSSPYLPKLQGKRVGLITNQTGVDPHLKTSIAKVQEGESLYHYQLTALFSPEHGLYGRAHSWENVKDDHTSQSIPIYSLHGTTRRPTQEMLDQVDLFIFDIQDIGSRSYTYISTLFYVMEAAAKNHIPVWVCDRPNPINGVTVDGPMLEEHLRSIVGYINVPYCHGMTVGELATFFNAEYQVGCALTVIPMKGWKRTMSFKETQLPWVPTSPQIPEPDTPLFYPMTGILGELQLVNIGVGYTLPFKLVGAPWIRGELFAQALNDQKFPGIHFQPFYYKPFFGRFKGQNCEGVRLVVTDHTTFEPVSTQYLLMGILKSLYPERFEEAMGKSQHRIPMFNKVNGTPEVFRILSQEKYIVWKLRALHQKQREAFKKRRAPYLISDYTP